MNIPMNIGKLWLFVCAFCLMACQTEESLDGGNQLGYLRIDASWVNLTETKSSVPENYRPTQLFVEIRNEAGIVVESTDNFEANWKGTQRTLKAGNYTITASSNGFDGQASGFDIPYYRGTKQITVQAGKLVNADVVCTLANVKVSVSFSEAFKQAFRSAKIKIISSITGIAQQQVTMGTNTTAAIYLPVGNFKAELEVVNQSNQTRTFTKELTEVQARDHYLLNYKTADQGNANIRVEVDGNSSEKIYQYTFNVATQVATSLGVKMAAAWSNFALLEGEVTSLSGTMDAAQMKFEYKKEGEDDSHWITVEATSTDNLTFQAKATGLTPNTRYTYHMKYVSEEETLTSESISFETEGQPLLPNGKLDDWYKNDKTWYAISQADYQAGNRFWDTSNPGSTTGAGALVNINPTTGNASIVHTAGGQSAELKSVYASAVGIGKFAAASLYAGQFKALVGTSGAKIDFGRPFTGRPTQLRGWYRYATGQMDYVGSGVPSGIVKNETLDLWSAYVVLTTGTYELDNTQLAATAKDFPALLKNDTDKFVVAYGAMPDAACIASSDWKEFTIDLVYKNLILKPTHVIIVISSSKYGDNFTGSTSSVLYLDDLEWVYGENPQTK